MKSLRLTSIWVCITIILAISCVDTDSQLNLKVAPERVSGAFDLMLQSQEDYDILLDNIDNMDSDLRKAWEKKGSFVSFKTVYEQALDEMESSTNESEFRNVLERYSDILKIENDNIEPVIRNSFYQSISNRDRIYTSGGFVLKVLDDQDILAMPIGEYKNLVIGSEAITWEETETIRKITYNSSPSHKQISSAKTNDCGLNFPWASYFDNHGGCSDDREVFVTAEAFIAVSIQTFIFKYQTEVQIWYRYPSTEIKVWGKLRNWLCSWRDYKTELNLRNVDYTVVSYSTQSVGYWGFPTLSTPTTTRVVLPPVNTPETYLYAKLQRIPDHLIDEWDVLTIEPYRFIEIHMEASSRGVGNNWAIIDCR